MAEECTEMPTEILWVLSKGLCFGKYISVRLPDHLLSISGPLRALPRHFANPFKSQGAGKGKRR
jgi:hypothetical protein